MLQKKLKFWLAGQHEHLGLKAYIGCSQKTQNTGSVTLACLPSAGILLQKHVAEEVPACSKEGGDEAWPVSAGRRLPSLAAARAVLWCSHLLQRHHSTERRLREAAECCNVAAANLNHHLPHICKACIFDQPEFVNLLTVTAFSFYLIHLTRKH